MSSGCARGRGLRLDRGQRSAICVFVSETLDDGREQGGCVVLEGTSLIIFVGPNLSHRWVVPAQGWAGWPDGIIVGEGGTLEVPDGDGVMIPSEWGTRPTLGHRWLDGTRERHAGRVQGSRERTKSWLG